MSEEIPYKEIRTYFGQALAAYGPTPVGVDWNSTRSQEVRFEQVLKVVDPSRPFSINDYGCGYGALVDYLTRKGWTFTYTGFDILEPMVAKARSIYKDRPECNFVYKENELPLADYTVLSGVFNKKFDTADEAWLAYVYQILERMDQISQKGFSFNMLTRYSDPEYMLDDLYYADPCQVFDHCKRRFSRNVALLHDYDLYDFTIIVRK